MPNIIWQHNRGHYPMIEVYTAIWFICFGIYLVTAINP